MDGHKYWGSREEIVRSASSTVIDLSITSGCSGASLPAAPDTVIKPNNTAVTTTYPLQ